MKNKAVISEDVALNDLEAFINEWVEKPEPKDKLAESYPMIFEALMSGNLVLENKIPTYKMVAPIKNDKGEISISDITFKTRISPINQANLAKGLDVRLDEPNYALNCLCYIIGKSKHEVDHFRQKDFSTVREISSLFMNAG